MIDRYRLNFDYNNSIKIISEIALLRKKEGKKKKKKKKGSSLSMEP